MVVLNSGDPRWRVRVSFPDSFETTRLHAERLCADHAGLIHAMHQDPGQMATLGGLRTATQTAEYMGRNLEHWARHGFGIWLLRERSSGVVAGRALLRHLDLEGVDEVEVGYSFWPAFWGRGLATEVAMACLEHGRGALGLSSIVALTLPDNRRSQRVMIKLGMRYDRDLVHAGLPHVLYRSVPPQLER